MRGSNFNNYKVQINDDPPIDPASTTPETLHETFRLDLTAGQTKGDKVTIMVINGDKTTTRFEVKTTAAGPGGQPGAAGAKPQISGTAPTTLIKNQAAPLTVHGSNFKNYSVKVNGEAANPLEPKVDSFKVELTAVQTHGDKVTITVINEDGSETSADVRTT